MDYCTIEIFTFYLGGVFIEVSDFYESKEIIGLIETLRWSSDLIFSAENSTLGSIFDFLVLG